MDKSSQLLVLTGVAGSGKTTLGKRIAAVKQMCFVDKDTLVEEAMFMLFNPPIETFRFREIQTLGYKTSLNVANENLALGNSVVLVLPMVSQMDDFDKWLEMTSDFKFDSVKFVWMEHDEKIEHERLLKRNAKRDEWKLEHWSEYCQMIKDVNAIDDRYNALVLSQKQTLSELEREVLLKLD